MVNHTRCCVPGCNDTRSAKRTLPVLDEKVYTIWVERIGNPSLKTTDPKIAQTRYRVCDRHFSNFCHAPGSKKLKVGSLPTLHLPGFSEVSTYENSIYKHSNSTSNKSNDNDALPLDFNVNDLINKLLANEPNTQDDTCVSSPQIENPPEVDKTTDYTILENLVFQQINEIQNIDMVTTIPFWEPENFDETYLDEPKEQASEVKDVPAPDLLTLTTLDLQLISMNHSNMILFSVL